MKSVEQTSIQIVSKKKRHMKVAGKMVSSMKKKARPKAELSATDSTTEVRSQCEIDDQDASVTPSANSGNVETEESWMQRASWKFLVGETGRLSFSFGSKNSNVTGSKADSGDKTSPETLESLPPSGPSRHSVGNVGQCKVRVNCFETEDAIVSHGNQKSVRANQDDMLERRLHPELPAQAPKPIDDRVCLFMRSETSEQEWLEARRMVKQMTKCARKDAMQKIKIFRSSKPSYGPRTSAYE